MAKRGYSKKVRALGAGIIILEVATVIVFLLAVYSNAITVSSVFRSLATTGNGVQSGNGPLFVQNATVDGQRQQAFVLPSITNDGFLPVTLSLNAIFLNSQGQTISTALNKNVTIAAHSSTDFIIPLGQLTSIANGASAVKIHFEISSVYGLVGGGLTATVSK